MLPVFRAWHTIPTLDRFLSLPTRVLRLSSLRNVDIPFYPRWRPPARVLPFPALVRDIDLPRILQAAAAGEVPPALAASSLHLGALQVPGKTKESGRASHGSRPLRQCGTLPWGGTSIYRKSCQLNLREDVPRALAAS